MRWLILAATLALQIALRAGSAEITVLSWNMQWFPSGSAKALSVEVEAARIHVAAVVLREANADILVLQEVRDAATAERLAAEIGGGFRTAVCSAFKDRIGGTPG